MLKEIIITFRNRHEHLEILVPILKKMFLYTNYSITVVEQCNDFKFYKSILYNVAIEESQADVLILSDVDYVPTSNVIYYDNHSDLYLPVGKAIFVDNKTLEERDVNRIPVGYRHFYNGVDSNFYGGVLTFRHDALLSIGGFNPLYLGWGLEDADIGRRAQQKGLKICRGQGLFKVLEHDDNFPGMDDPHFQWNQNVFQNADKTKHIGLNATKVVKRHSYIKAHAANVDKWIEVLEAEIEQ